MANLELMRRLTIGHTTKIVLLIMDGLGGLPLTPDGPTELEAAHRPNLNRLAAEGCLGLSVPVALGVSPGSGPAHLALFGYDPIQYDIGRGVLEAFGIGVPVGARDVAARGNFCTVDQAGNISNRRAGRIKSEEAAPIVARLAQIKVPGVEIEVQPVKEYRFVVVFRGEGLAPDIDETDPQRTGVPPMLALARAPGAKRTAELVNAWIAQARQVLASEPRANALTLRGFSSDPNLPKFREVYKLRASCTAVYPMYKGVSQLVGMDVQHFEGDRPDDQFAHLKKVWKDYDFFFVHVKPTDSRGEDGDFDGKVKVIEAVDAALPALIELKPDVLIVTGDHSTPAKLRAHSWHPVPLLLWAPGTAMPDGCPEFGERACMGGGLGRFPATDLMPLALGHALRLERYGA
ncbi:MAG: 2,3-bisphosphoglycerate-independent phosphoglycerate mutase [Anaerolineales bacterium]|nr:2,3-bisphosphoglycerate-independent phosphoglycerate mutase [Anaerolineales bacterium]